MKTNKRDWLHYITGVVTAVIVLAATVDAANITPVPQPKSCCCCCCCQNKDEVIYTFDDAQQEPSTYPIGEPPPRPVILSR